MQDSKFKMLSRKLRKNSTDVETFVWQQLRNKKIGYKFYRQYPIGEKYIVDFIYREKKLIIECDGGQHSENLNDVIRDDYLKEQGYTILRFWNNEILLNWEGCLYIILKELGENIEL